MHESSKTESNISPPPMPTKISIYITSGYSSLTRAPFILNARRVIVKFQSEMPPPSKYISSSFVSGIAFYTCTRNTCISRKRIYSATFLIPRLEGLFDRASGGLRCFARRSSRNAPRLKIAVDRGIDDRVNTGDSSRASYGPDAVIKMRGSEERVARSDG